MPQSSTLAIMAWRLTLFVKGSVEWKCTFYYCDQFLCEIISRVQGAEAKYGIGRIGFMPLLQSLEAKYEIILKKIFFCLISPISEKKKKNMINLNSYD